MSENDEDVPQLSAETFLALHEFYEEQEERENQLLLNGKVTLDEDWQLSQFWYDDNTVETLVKVVLKSVGINSKIALVSCPTLYRPLKEKVTGEVTLFEYDTRFTIHGEDFIFYDYKSPLSIPRDRSNYYDLVIADPPFLSEECLTKTAVTVKFLTKSRIIICTGAVMETLIGRLLDVKKTWLKPQHKNNLANEFCCYSNFDIGIE